ncbi:HAD family hydrolase [Lacticaseibacillus parakribbianus]|uniref:HAD family hydrolase n=1 Tax=Lacticaseibacillus parakribbianus TaxID=2970927 RepID=UPI0021CB84DB|nr:HAD family hydrolase [Lacticaseibacillus parakribbianus]
MAAGGERAAAPSTRPDPTTGATQPVGAARTAATTRVSGRSAAQPNTAAQPDVSDDGAAVRPGILWLDCGDTLVDEDSQVFDDAGNVLTATLLPDALAVLTALQAAGWRLGLVADGRVRSFENILASTGLAPLFETRTISEAVGQEKPAAAMFAAAQAAMHLTAGDLRRTVMVGNNLARDVQGANAFGVLSVWYDWSPRYPHAPSGDLQQPTATITALAQLPAALDALI